MTTNNKRRSKGQGTIVKLGYGKYRAETTYTDLNGKRKKLRSETVSTPAKAEKELQKLVRKKEQLKKASTVDIERCSVKQYMENYYLPWKKTNLKEQSYRRVESTIETHIIGKFKMKIFMQLTTNEIQSHLEEMFQKKYSHSTIKKVHDAYSNIFKYAVNIRHDIAMDDNPMMGVSMIPEHKFPETEIKWMKPDEIKAFTETATRKFATGAPVHKYGSVYLFILNTGLREGEICALNKSDVDLNKRLISVNKGVNTVVKERSDGSNEYNLAITTPKTRNSNRYVPMNENAVKYAREIMEQFPNGELFIYNSTGKIVRPDTLYKQFNSILRSAELEQRGIHALRHSFVTVLFEKGVDTHTIAELIGDTEDTVKKTYLHLFKERKAKAVEAINID